MIGNIDWDVFDAPGAMGANSSKAGIREPLDLPLVDPKDMVVGTKNYLALLSLLTAVSAGIRGSLAKANRVIAAGHPIGGSSRCRPRRPAY
jgi:hypothetical protein